MPYNARRRGPLFFAPQDFPPIEIVLRAMPGVAWQTLRRYVAIRRGGHPQSEYESQFSREVGSGRRRKMCG
jgi:hypothetical protein